MKKTLTALLLSSAFTLGNAQWNKAVPTGIIVNKSDKSLYYSLDIDQIRTQLSVAQKFGNNAKTVMIKLPTDEGKIERFAVNSFPVMDEALAAQYSLGSYVGVGIDDPSKYIRFSVAPDDFQSLMIAGGKYTFIESATADKKFYSVFSKRAKDKTGFTCLIKEDPADVQRKNALRNDVKEYTAKSGNKTFTTLRLALSVTGEYTAYFGGTKPAITQINKTLTAVNGVFEQEFNVHVNMIYAPLLIFTNSSGDPYSNQTCPWNLELMHTLHDGHYGVTDADFDIGHLFGTISKGGHAGCFGCIGSNDTSTYISQECGPVPGNYKGAAYTSKTKPFGASFDIDFVAHEMGHQLGGYHTFSMWDNTGSNMEPGSGSTIMGYAGLTGEFLDIAEHSDPYFHSRSIDEVQANLASKPTVGVKTVIANNPPVVTPMTSITYTIPKSTPFVLTAAATDPDGDALTYCWEQFDSSSIAIGPTGENGSGISNNPWYGEGRVLGQTDSGANYRSLPPSTSPTRYFPNLQAVLDGNVADMPNWESTSSIARSQNFRVTVRDNNAGGQAQTAFTTQKIDIGDAEAFTVDAVSGASGDPVNLTWVVSGTNASPYNVANVKIDYTNDNGATWNQLLASTPNNGTATVTFPPSNNAEIYEVRVSAIGNVFYAVNQATMSPTLATAENTKTAVAIYPNPATDVINIKNISDSATYEIHNAAGQILAKGKVNDGRIKVNNLIKGIYFISLEDKGSFTKTKFIKE